MQKIFKSIEFKCLLQVDNELLKPEMQKKLEVNYTDFEKLSHIIEHGLQGFIVEGFRAKRAYIGFWPIFIFLQDRANFSQTDLF